MEKIKDMIIPYGENVLGFVLMWFLMHVQNGSVNVNEKVYHLAAKKFTSFDYEKLYHVIAKKFTTSGMLCSP